MRKQTFLSQYPIRFFKLSKDQNNWVMNPQSGSHIKILWIAINIVRGKFVSSFVSAHNIFICDPLWGFIPQLFWSFDNLKNLIGYRDCKQLREDEVPIFRIFSKLFPSYRWHRWTKILPLIEFNFFRHLRLAELLRMYSSESEMVVMTLPLPRRGHTSPALYMAWLDIMTKNLPPILLTRGNQEPVLTFYS